MCKELCDDEEDGTTCQDCGIFICYDVKSPDDLFRPAFLASSGDLYCDRCGRSHERAEEEEYDEDFGCWPDDVDPENVGFTDEF